MVTSIPNTKLRTTPVNREAIARAQKKEAEKYNSIGSGQGAYVNIDDIKNPNADVYTRDDNNFNRVTEPVVYQQPKRSGGGSNRGIPDQINKIADIARAETTISNIESGKRFNELTNTATSNNNFITASALANANSRTQSTWSPTTKEIANAGFKGQVSKANVLTAQQKVLSDQLTEIATRDARSFAEQEGQRARNDYQRALELEETKLNSKYEEIQNKINAGGDYDKLVKEFEREQKKANNRLTLTAESLDSRTSERLNSYITNWKNTKGRNLEADAGLVLRNTDRLARLSKKELGGRFKDAFIGGAVVGGGVTGILQLTGKTISKSVGVGITAVGAGLSLGLGYATAGYQVATGKLNKDEFLVEGGSRAVEGGVSFLGGFSGAVVGSVAVTTGIRLIETGVVKGITAQEKSLATRSLEKNGFKMTTAKGKVNESSIKNLKIDGNAKAELLSESRAGNIVRRTTWKPDTRGLTPEEIKALSRFGIKVEHYQVIDTKGNLIKTFEVSRVTGRAPVTKLYGGADSVISKGEGVIKDGKVELFRTSVKTKGMNFRDRVSLNKQFKQRTNEVSLERVTGKGSIKYNRGYRFETSSGKGESFLRFKPDRTELFPKITESSTKITSKRMARLDLFTSNGKGGGVLAKSVQYKDILGTGSSNTKAPNFLFSKAPPSKVFRSLPELSKGDFISTASSSTGNTGTTSLVNPTKVLTTTKAPVVLSGLISNSATEVISATPVNTRLSILPSLSFNTPQRQESFNINSPRTNLGVNDLDILGTRNRGGFFTGQPTATTPNLNLGSSTAIGVAQTPSLAQLQKPITRQITTPVSRTPATLTPNLNFTDISFPALGGFGLPFLGRVKVGGGGFGIKERGGLFKKTAYNADLGSVLINYRRPLGKISARELSSKTFTGLGLRPQLDFSGKKRKKSRKK
jgi:hypothetical protein